VDDGRRRQDRRAVNAHEQPVSEGGQQREEADYRQKDERRLRDHIQAAAPALRVEHKR